MKHDLVLPEDTYSNWNIFLIAHARSDPPEHRNNRTLFFSRPVNGKPAD